MSVVNNELQRIYLQHGRLTADLVLKEATDPASPLHPHFEWDDTAAAAAYRLAQAGQLIRQARVTIVRPDQTVSRVRAFHYLADGTDEAPEPTYVPLENVIANPALHERVVQRAWRELAMWSKRYKDIAELTGAVQVVDDLVAEAS